MNTHLTDEELVQHFYGDGRLEDEPQVDAHLKACSTCEAAWSELSETLRLVDASEVPEPGPEFERVMWARVQQGLDRRPRVSLFGTWLSKNDTRGRFLLPAAGLAAAVVVAVLVAGRFSPKGWQTTATAPPPAVTSVTAPDTRSRERVLLSALDSHFQQSEMLLVEVMNAPAAGYDNFGFERETADDLLGSSRLYRATAELNGNVQFAQLLEDLESVLVEIARSPEKIDRKEFGALRARIDSDNLLFKVRAVSKQIQDRQRSLTE
jgi:hypothetical protein